MRPGIMFHCLRSTTRMTAIVSAILIGPVGGALAADDGASGHGTNLWNSVLETLNVKTTIGPTPDFVEATHPDPSGLKFIPTGTPHPKRPSPAKSATDIEAAKDALDAARNAQLAPKLAKTKTPSKPKLAKPPQTGAEP